MLPADRGVLPDNRTNGDSNAPAVLDPQADITMAWSSKSCRRQSNRRISYLRSADHCMANVENAYRECLDLKGAVYSFTDGPVQGVRVVSGSLFPGRSELASSNVACSKLTSTTVVDFCQRYRSLESRGRSKRTALRRTLITGGRRLTCIWA